MDHSLKKPATTPLIAKAGPVMFVVGAGLLVAALAVVLVDANAPKPAAASATVYGAGISAKVMKRTRIPYYTLMLTLSTPLEDIRVYVR
jgi:hypothetical protein